MGHEAGNVLEEVVPVVKHLQLRLGKLAVVRRRILLLQT